jgi:nicotinate phosphoribosyltransferase
MAPLIEAQLVETIILNQIHFQTLVASKAARIVTAAAGRMVVDFGSRRAPGAEAAVRVARASYLVGASGTSLVLAGKHYGIPVFGTMAHSYIQAHDDEAAAFSAFAREFPETTLLVDTYNTLEGVQKVIDLSRQLGGNFRVRAIRLDSGNLEQLAKESRRMLDAAGLQSVKIFLSSELDEHRIAALLAAGAPIDGFGVGTKLAVSDDASHVDLVYKLVEYAGRGRTKRSSSKILYPGRKQVFREFVRGKMQRDWIGRFDEQIPGERLLVPVMRTGQRLPAGRVSIEVARRHAMAEINERLPENLRQLTTSEPYPVTISKQLQRDYQSLSN